MILQPVLPLQMRYVECFLVVDDSLLSARRKVYGPKILRQDDPMVVCHCLLSYGNDSVFRSRLEF